MAASLAARSGFQALYLSGAGVANASYGVPDVGLTTLAEGRMCGGFTGVSRLPLLVDADTGWGNPGKAARELCRSGAAGMHLEDQVEAKKCGHLAGKRLVSAAEMARRIRAAVRGRSDAGFVIMARTDAVASEGLAAGIERACRYRDAGADMIFAEALTELDDYRRFVEAVKVPVLANITEFGKTPLFSVKELASAGVGLALYPLSAFRAMNAAALRVYRAIRERGTQRGVLRMMQTRAELYELLGYDVSATKRVTKVR